MQNTSVEHTNIALIYEYTESVVKAVNDGVRSLNTKLSGIIGLSGVLLKFAGDLEHSTDWFIGLQILICILLVVASWVGLVGLQPKGVGNIVRPKELRKDFYHSTEEECRRYIVDGWIDAIVQLDKHRDEKQEHLKVAIVFFALATTLYASDICLNSSF